MKAARMSGVRHRQRFQGKKTTQAALPCTATAGVWQETAARQLYIPVSMGHQLSHRMQPCSQLQTLQGPGAYRQSGCAQETHQ